MSTEQPEQHCPTCYCGRRAPLQRSDRTRHGPGTISWAEHLECYAAYSAKYGTDQSAETLARRGGFGWSEFVTFTGHEPTTWRPR